MLLKAKHRIFGLLALTMLLTGCSTIDIKSGVLDPQGPVAKTQYDLIIWSISLMIFIIVTVSALFIYMLVKYRAKKLPEGYKPPNVEGNNKLEILWTIIPVIIITLLAVPTVNVLFDLEKSPSPEKEPLVIEATTMDWKWVFKYPEQGISTVNYLKIPADRPIRFKLNSSGPMGALWIPELGGMKYTMPQMDMYLWLEADRPGTYIGKNANYTGEGFTHMDFEVESMEQAKFDQWVKEIKETAPPMEQKDWEALLEQSVVGEMSFSSYPETARLPHQDPNLQQNPNGTIVEKDTGGHQH